MTMYLQVCAVCVILCNLIPGVCCYDYNISGLVVSSLFAFFLLMPIIAMLFVIVQWRDWYERKQNREGKVKQPRKEWYIFPQREKRSRTAASSPNSERKALRMQTNIHTYVPGSRHTTLSRHEYPVPGQWVGSPPPPPPINKYEEKTQTMQFDPEEETVVVAELLPDPQQGQMHTTQYRQTQVQNQTTFSGPSTSSYEVTAQSDAQGQTTYVKLNQNDASQYARQPAPTRTIQSKPYHVQMTSEPGDGFTMRPANDTGFSSSTTPARVNLLSQTVGSPGQATHASWLSQTTVPSTSTTQAPRLSQTMISTSGQGVGVFVPPYETRASPVEEGTAVFSFDTDNDPERTPIDQPEDVVLF